MNFKIVIFRLVYKIRKFILNFVYFSGHQPSLSSTPMGGANPMTSNNGVTSTTTVNGGFPPKSQIKRQKMVYHCKFGEFGVLEGQFTEPSGVGKVSHKMSTITIFGDKHLKAKIYHKIWYFS